MMSLGGWLNTGIILTRSELRRDLLMQCIGIAQNKVQSRRFWSNEDASTCPDDVNASTQKDRRLLTSILSTGAGANVPIRSPDQPHVSVAFDSWGNQMLA